MNDIFFGSLPSIKGKEMRERKLDKIKYPLMKEIDEDAIDVIHHREGWLLTAVARAATEAPPATNY